MPNTLICPHLVRNSQHSHMTMCNTSCQNSSTLISDHVRTHHIRKALHLHPTMFKNTASEGINTYSYPCSKAPHWKGSVLTFDHVRSHHVKRALGPRLRIPRNWPGSSILPENGVSHYIWSSENTTLNNIRMALHLYLIMWDYIP